jgi:ATP-dependent protease Clp ATPase subunit
VFSRRRFLFLVGSAAPGLWLAGSGLIRLERRFVLALGGSCSFCGKAANDVGALAGALGRPTRICDGCIDLCCQILAEQSLHPSGRLLEERSATEDDDLHRLLRDLQPGDLRATLDGIVARIRKQMDGRRRTTVADFQCSFCDGHRRDVAKLISGPRAFICDTCVGDATAVLSHVLRPAVT